MNTELNANQGAFDGKKEALVKDLKNVVADADGLLKEVANSTVEEFAAARASVEARLSDARSRLHDARVNAAKKACEATEATQAYVRENPWKVVGVAALAGLVTAFLLSRR